MTLLQPAYSDQFGLKLGALGLSGAGKTYTLTALAIGLSKTYHNNAPIAFFDTEKQSDFVAGMCAMEGVPLLVKKSKSFIDMRETFAEAEQTGCCAFIADSYTHPSIELHQAFKESADLVGRRTQFHHNDQPQRLWDQWTDTWKASRLHCLFAARLGFTYGDVTDENGDVQHVKLDTKMKGGDGGYEPNLVIEFEAIDDTERRHVKSRRKAGITTHWLRVRKDRCQTLNGRQFPFEDTNGYKVGDFAKIMAAIQPHLDCLAITQPVAVEHVSRSSVGLFQTPRGESKGAERERRVAVALEEIEDTLAFFWPSSNGTEDKRLRSIVRKMLFGLRSETAIKALLPEVLESARAVMAHFESAAADPEQKVNVKVEAQVIDLVQSCLDLEKNRVADMVT